MSAPLTNTNPQLHRLLLLDQLLLPPSTSQARRRHRAHQRLFSNWQHRRIICLGPPSQRLPWQLRHHSRHVRRHDCGLLHLPRHAPEAQQGARAAGSCVRWPRRRGCRRREAAARKGLQISCLVHVRLMMITISIDLDYMDATRFVYQMIIGSLLLLPRDHPCVYASLLGDECCPPKSSANSWLVQASYIAVFTTFPQST